MTITSARSARAVLGVFAVSALLLTGCAGGQSKEEACTQLNSELQDASTELSESVTTLSTDPQGAVDALETFEGSFSEAVDGISNDEISDLAENIEEALGEYIDVTSDAVENPENADSEALTDAIENFQAETQAFSEACGS